jgi:hypothetical protein
MKPNEVLDGYLNDKKFQVCDSSAAGELSNIWRDVDVSSLHLDTVRGLCKYNRIRLKPEPYKKEYIVEFDAKADYSIDGSGYEILLDIFPRTVNKTYKVTIEEITND